MEKHGRYAEMEAGKRICGGSGDSGRKRAKAADGGGRQPVEAAAAAQDDEVEEFFAILRRVRVAVKYLKKSENDEGGPKLTARATAGLWSPSFERKDFEGVNGDVKCQEGTEESAGLDLNADPI